MGLTLQRARQLDAGSDYQRHYPKTCPRSLIPLPGLPCQLPQCSIHLEKQLRYSVIDSQSHHDRRGLAFQAGTILCSLGTHGGSARRRGKDMITTAISTAQAGQYACESPGMIPQAGSEGSGAVMQHNLRSATIAHLHHNLVFTIPIGQNRERHRCKRRRAQAV